MCTMSSARLFYCLLFSKSAVVPASGGPHFSSQFMRLFLRSFSYLNIFFCTVSFPGNIVETCLMVDGDHTVPFLMFNQLRENRG